MKNIIRIIKTLSFLAFLILTGCVDLEEKPVTFFSPTNFYKNSADAVAAVNAVYDGLTDPGWMYANNLLYIIEYPTEMVTNNRWGGNNFEYATWSSGQAEFDQVWIKSYMAINRANAVIDRVPNIPNMNDKLKNRIVGEAKFIRALLYFNIVRLWGDAPLYDKQTTDLSDVKKSRTPAAQIYALIISDLQFAAQNCYKKASYTASSDKMRVSSGAAKALLAKVYLTMAGNPVKDATKLPLAETLLKEVIDGNEYSLCTNYFDIFDENKKNGSEHIFSITYGSNMGWGNGNILGHYTMPSDYVNMSAFSWGEITMEPEFVLNNFDTAVDQRARQGMLLQYQTKGGKIKKWGKDYSNPYIRKYTDCKNGSGWGNYGIDIPVLRYGDVLLMYAEVVNEQRGATAEVYNTLKLVQDRAKITGTASSGLVAGLTKDQMRNLIIKERKRELFAEWHGWFDYVRWGIFKSHMEGVAKTIPAYPSTYSVGNQMVLMPIPQNQILANPNLTQNPGY